MYQQTLSEVHEANTIHSLGTPDREYAESEFGGTSVMMSDISYRDKKNRVDWTHPHVIYLKDLGWDKVQIQQAYFILKNGDGVDAKERKKLRLDNDKFCAHMIIILKEELGFEPVNRERIRNDRAECIDKMYQNFVCCLCCNMLKRVDSGGAFCDCGCCCYYLCQTCQLCHDKVEKEDNDFTAEDVQEYYGFIVTKRKRKRKK